MSLVYGGRSSVGRAPRCGRGCRESEPLRPPQWVSHSGDCIGLQNRRAQAPRRFESYCPCQKNKKKEEKRMEKEFEYKEEYGWLTNICLNVTDACNLACRYCFVEQHPHYMSLDVAIQAVNFVINNLKKKNKKFKKNEKASITFFGGEPTLRWDEIIVPVTTYIRENNYPISLSITTRSLLKDDLNPVGISFVSCGIITKLSCSKLA